MSRRIAAGDYKQYDDDFADKDVVFIWRLSDEESTVEIIHQIGSAPIELGAHRGHKGSEECGDHHPAQSGWQKVAHDHDVALFRLGRKDCTGMQATVRGIDRYGYQRGENPGPRTKRIMRDVEPQRRRKRIFFVFSAEHSLRYISAAAGF